MRTNRLLPAIPSLPPVWIAVALVACAATGPAPEAGSPAPTRVETRLARSPELLAVDAGSATDDLERFLEDWPGSSLADDAALELARRAARAGDHDGAARHLIWAARIHADGDRIDEIQLLLAEVERARGHDEAAYRSAARIRLAQIAPEERHRVHVLLAELAGERGDHALALRWWARAHGSAADQPERDRVDSAIDGLLASLSPHELERAADKLDGSFPELRVRLRLVELALDAQDADRARRELERAARLQGTTAENERRAALGERLDGVDRTGSSAADLPGFSDVAPMPSLHGARGTLGVVLPLSGSFAGFGEECLRGVLLAAGVFGPEGTGGGVRVAVRDSGGTAEGAVAAVQQLARDGSISAIVGPLLASEAEAAAAAANDARIPLLALTGRDDVVRDRPFVFRVGREQRGEIQVLVDHAVRAGIGRFAILYPDDAYGRSARDLFWTEVEARGGLIVGAESYEAGATDFARPIRNLVGYKLLTAEQERAIKERSAMRERAQRLPLEEAVALREQAAAMTGPHGEPLPPIVEFDALFLPDGYEQVTLIAPQLAFHEVMGMRLLGSSGWNHPDLVRIGGDHVNGAVFTETFHPASEVPYVARFSQDFQGAFAAAPGSLAALSFDAANLVLAQLARGQSERSAMRESLLDVRVYPGVSGVTSMRADGTAQKRPYLLGVRNGRIVSLD